MKVHRLRAMFVLLGMALCALHARAGCKIDKLEIPVRIVNQRPVGTLNLNGTEVSLLIDSGAFYSFLTPSAAAQLGLELKALPEGMRIEGYTGGVEARVARVERVLLQTAEFSDVEFIVGGNELGSSIQGILGRNFLSSGDTEYDLAHGMVRLMFPNSDCAKRSLAYWAGDEPVIEVPLAPAAYSHDTTIVVTARVNDVEVKAMLDTGAPRTTMKWASAIYSGISQSEYVETERAGGMGKGRARSWMVPIRSFEIGSEKIMDGRFNVADVHGQGMLLGLDYFLSHRIYVSRLQRKLYATWNGSQVFASGTSEQHNFARAARPAEVAGEDAAFLARRGEASAARGDLAAALADMNRACELEPQSGSNFFARARVHAALKQFWPARRDLDESLRLQPNLHEAQAIRASMRAAVGERGGALLDLLMLDMALPPASHLREAMAEIYVRLDQPSDALRQWELWVPTHRTDAHLAKVLHSRCRLRTRLNIDLEQALRDCEEAVDRDRGELAYRESLGWVCLRLDDPRRAVRVFDAVIGHKRTPFALYGRALAHQRLSDDDAAESDLQSARRLQPGIDAELRRAGLPVAEQARMRAEPSS